MAIDGKIEGTTSNEHISALITWKAEKNINGNYSDVTATLTYSRTNSGYTTAGYWSGSLSIGDSEKEITGAYITITKDSNTVAITHTAKVEHNADGSMSVHISATGKMAKGTLSSTTIGDDVELETIPRASSITGADDVVLGSKCNVRWTPNSSAFRYKLTFSLGDWSHTTEKIHPNRTSSYSYTGYMLPVAVAEEITQDSQATMDVTLTTYADSECTELIGQMDAVFTVTVPDTEETQPTVTMELTADTPIEGLYLQGLSRVCAALSAEPKLGTAVESFYMTAGGRNYAAPYLSEPLTSVGDVQIVGCAVDQRGITGYAYQTVKVLPYSKPRLIDVAAYRCTSEGIAADDGEYLRLKATRIYAPVETEGGRNNFCRIRYRYKAENAEGYSDYVTILDETADVNTVITDPLLNATFSKATAYTVQINAVDTVGQEATVIISIASERVFRHKRPGGKGLGLGGYCAEDDLLDVHWNQRVRKDLNVDGKLCGVCIRVAPSVPESNTLTLRTTVKYPDLNAVQSIVAFGSGWVQTWLVTGYGYVDSSGGSSVGQVTDSGDFLISLSAKRDTPIVMISAEPFEIIE